MTEPSDVRVPGFWAATAAHLGEILTGWQLWLSAVLGAALGVLLPTKQLANSYAAVGGAELGIAATLLGVILAGLAVLVVFVSEDYMDLFAELDDPKKEFDDLLFPFWFACGLATSTILLATAILLTTEVASQVPRRVLIATATGSFIWMLFVTMGVVGLIAGHGSNRARQLLDRRKRSL